MRATTFTQQITPEEAKALDQFRQAKAVGRSELRFVFRRHRVTSSHLEVIEEWANDGKQDDN